MDFTKEQLSELICKHTAQGVSARGGSFREQVQRLPSRQDLRSRTNINLPHTA